MPAADQALLAIVVIHHRTPELLRRCLHCLQQHVPEAWLCVLDNEHDDAAHAHTLAVLEDFSGWHSLRGRNHSYAAAVNQALQHSRAPYVAVMNADVFVAAGVFPALLAALQPPAVALTGPRCLNAAGGWQNQGLPYWLYYAWLEHKLSEQLPVPWLSGCLQLIKREAIAQVGGMNASLRFCNEDMEWCWRLRRAGYRCVLVRETVTHLGGSATPDKAAFVFEGYRGSYWLAWRYGSCHYRRLHRLVAWLEVSWRQRHVSSAEQQRAYRAVQHMLASGDIYHSPFGEHLGDLRMDALLATELATASAPDTRTQNTSTQGKGASINTRSGKR